MSGSAKSFWLSNLLTLLAMPMADMLNLSHLAKLHFKILTVATPFAQCFFIESLERCHASRLFVRGGMERAGRIPTTWKGSLLPFGFPFQIPKGKPQNAELPSSAFLSLDPVRACASIRPSWT